MNPRKKEIKVISKCSFYRLGRGNKLKSDFLQLPRLAKKSRMKQSANQYKTNKKITAYDE